MSAHKRSSYRYFHEVYQCHLCNGTYGPRDKEDLDLAAYWFGQYRYQGPSFVLRHRRFNGYW